MKYSAASLCVTILATLSSAHAESCKGTLLYSKSTCISSNRVELQNIDTKEQCIDGCDAIGANFAVPHDYKKGPNIPCRCFMEDTCERATTNSYRVYTLGPNPPQEKQWCFRKSEPKNLVGSYTTEECIQGCVAEGAKFASSANQATNPNDGTCTCHMADYCDHHPINSRDLYLACSPVTPAPTPSPTKAPTKAPTDAPTKTPTPAPSLAPTPKSTVCEGERLISEKAFCHNSGAKNLEGSYTTEECIQTCVAEGAKFVASANQVSSNTDQRCTCFMEDTCDKKAQNSFDLYKACTLSTTPKSVAVPPQAAPSSAPTKSPTVASSSGDPHFKTWSGAKFDYHGECDLVLLDNPSFNNGQGLKVHIRTTRVQYYSYIEKIAVKIGDDVLEFANDAENFVLNGSPAEPKRKHHETLLGGFVLRRDHKSISLRLHGDRHDRDAIAKIDFHSRKNGFPAVVVDGGNTDVFKGSLGLLGDWETGSKLARDGVTEIAVGEDGNATAFALEWQVRDTEPMLFQEARFPQFPTQCTPPKKILGGRLGKSHMQELAQKACANFKGDQDDCIFDVIATRSAAAASQE